MEGARGDEEHKVGSNSAVAGGDRAALSERGEEEEEEEEDEEGRGRRR